MTPSLLRREGAMRAQPASPLSGSIKAPGDKSISHRAFILGGLAEGVTEVSGLLESDDVINSGKAAAALGATVEHISPGQWRITGTGGRFSCPASPLDFGNAGTGVRLMMGAVAGSGASADFVGDESLSSRPMRRVTDPLGEMGARFTTTDGRLPVHLEAAPLTGIHYTPPIASAQVKSAVLLAALGATGTTIVHEPQITRDHTETMLNAFGVNLLVERDGPAATITLDGPQTLTACPIDVPGDPSSSAFAMVAALIVPGSDITLTGVMDNPARTGLIDTLREMGADITLTPGPEMAGEKTMHVRVRHSRLRGITVPAERAPSMIDEYPILCVAAAFASGRTVMHGLAELRVKESDRLGAILNGLSAAGVDVSEGGDSLTIEGCGGRPKGGNVQVETHFDHRIAMSFLVLGMASERPITIDDGTAISTSFPGFIDLMNQIGGKISETVAS